MVVWYHPKSFPHPTNLLSACFSPCWINTSNIRFHLQLGRLVHKIPFVGIPIPSQLSSTYPREFGWKIDQTAYWMIGWELVSLCRKANYRKDRRGRCIDMILNRDVEKILIDYLFNISHFSSVVVLSWFSCLFPISTKSNKSWITSFLMLFSKFVWGA